MLVGSGMVCVLMGYVMYIFYLVTFEDLYLVLCTQKRIIEVVNLRVEITGNIKDVINPGFIDSSRERPPYVVVSADTIQKVGENNEFLSGETQEDTFCI